MKKLILVLIALIGVGIVTSCNDTLEEMNVDTKHPTKVPGNYLFANAQKALADQVASTNVNLNNWKLWAQYWTETTYTDEANYDVVTRDIASNTFRTYYRNTLRDFLEAKNIIGEEEAVGDEEAAVKQNRILIADILMVYTYQRLVDMFGNVPYTEALDIENISPVYDDAFAIYKDLIKRLDTDLSGLNDSYGSYGGDDIYFGGDVGMWKKFANTLKVKLGITLSTVDKGLAQSTVESAYKNGFGPGELCQLSYLGGINANPIYQDMIQSGRHDFVGANTVIDIMNNLEDPRRYCYFTLIDTSSNPDEPKLVYLGGQYGHSSAYTSYSHIPNTQVDAGERLPTDVEGSNVADATFPMVLLDYTEMCFYLAEAAERGFSVGGSGEDWYNKGVTASMDWWLSKHYSAADVESMTSDYLANPDVAYSTAPGDWKEKIGTQAWLAFYYRGFVGYTSYRRLGYPAMNKPPNPYEGNGEVPRRITYPIAEQTLNAANYADAASAIGGDKLSTKIFWDK